VSSDEHFDGPLTAESVDACVDVGQLYEWASECAPDSGEADPKVCAYCRAYVRAQELEDAEATAALAAHQGSWDGVINSIEARVHELGFSSPGESDLSVNDWIKRVRGEATEAHMYVRTGQAGLEMTAWLNIAAIAARRVKQIRDVA